MSPTQIKIAVYGGVLVLAWLWRSRSAAPATADTARVVKTLDVVDDINSPYFGMTDAEIAAQKNPAEDPEMRRLIDVSNQAIAADVGGSNQ